ncbi:hypothetical protein BH10CYA1_BH10CYA1_30450 [soil metagenome]
MSIVEVEVTTVGVTTTGVTTPGATRGAPSGGVREVESGLMVTGLLASFAGAPLLPELVSASAGAKEQLKLRSEAAMSRRNLIIASTFSKHRTHLDDVH